MEGARERLEREQKDRTQQAWVTAGLSRADKLPKLDRLLGVKEAAPEPERIRAQLDALNKVLPKVTMEGWRARQSKRSTVPSA